MKTPKISDLRHRITLRQHTNTTDIGGALDPTYSNTFDCWAQVEPVGTAIYQQGVQLDDIVTHRVMIRYSPEMGRLYTDIGSLYEMLLDGWRYRVKRSGLLNGQKTFLVLEVQQEREINHD